MSLTARLFAYDLIKNTPNSELLRLLWELGKDRLSEHIFKHGARLGLRNVSVREFAALMESIFPKATLEQVDVEYVFAFLDWGGCGSVEFKVLVQSCRSLYASRNVVAVLCCRQLLYVKPLNDAVVTVGELDTMFSALQTLYASEVSVSVLRLCAEIKHLLLPYEVDYCFSAPLVQETFYRLPSFVALLERIEWDGRLRQSRGSLTRLTELVANERRDSQTAADAKKRRATRELYNKEVLNCYMDIYQGESKLEKSDDGKRYYNKKRLVCDRFMVRPDPTALMSE
ncbi:hypothetical protein AGDE_13512 [Angomonas deanei]|uniref:Uncharacterized protein n=1 Tax=Angomonas deanei TaxID=59799 RepID=A0A7G2C2Y2_9TRYP|nr:hypothetical protein AGDE_13512 [Angomonas deanei]CAD2213083.1 hypothetical protein, conserved [Angomonas deanei]|eukprot:EPY22219.1 hypothetical protein AGDE_13512 [Angomonas deanei]